MNDSHPQSHPLEFPPNCDRCQYCQDCDPKFGDPRHIHRFCDHGQISNFVELRDVRASGHDCPATGPLRRNANSGLQPGLPTGRWVAPSARNPLARSDRPPQDNARRKGTTFKKAYAGGNSTAHWGHVHRNEPEDEGPTVYEDLRSYGNANVHAGHIYGYADPRVAMPQPGERSQVYHGHAVQRESHLPATNSPEDKFWEDKMEE